MRNTRPGQLGFQQTVDGAGITCDSDPVAVRELRDQCNRWLDAYTAELEAETRVKTGMLDHLWPPGAPPPPTRPARADR